MALCTFINSRIIHRWKWQWFFLDLRTRTISVHRAGSQLKKITIHWYNNRVMNRRETIFLYIYWTEVKQNLFCEILNRGRRYFLVKYWTGEMLFSCKNTEQEILRKQIACIVKKAFQKFWSECHGFWRFFLGVLYIYIWKKSKNPKICRCKQASKRHLWLIIFEIFQFFFKWPKKALILL